MRTNASAPLKERRAASRIPDVEANFETTRRHYRAPPPREFDDRADDDLGHLAPKSGRSLERILRAHP